MTENNQPTTFTCSCCGGEFPIEDRCRMDDSDLCSTCFEESTVVCSSCGEVIWLSDNVGDDATPLCADCCEEFYVRCRDCGALLLRSDAEYDDEDEAYCPVCYRQHRTVIHDYNYKPEPIFYGSGPRFYGVELEIDGGGKDSRKARQLLEVINADEELAYIKSDGSLNDGLEIVTHPMDLDCQLHKMPWKALSEEALRLGYLSHKAGTCGLHIHVSRTALGDDEEEQEAVIGRILFFIERFWQELLRFSRRTEAQLSRWAVRYGYRDHPQDALKNAKGSGSRYSCLNLQNLHTIEFRIFRGTLNTNTIFAALQMVHAICSAAIVMSDEEMTALNWCSFVAGLDEQAFPALIRYLKERRLYVNEPIEREEEH